jgi:hypothetical protein
MNVIPVKAKGYKNVRLYKREKKQSQTNPTCSELVEGIRV